MQAAGIEPVATCHGRWKLQDTIAPATYVWSEPLPRPEQMTPALLEQLLAAGGREVRIARLTCERVGTGQIGDTVRYHLTYARGSGPTSVIGKFASSDPTSLAIAADWSLYEREVRFYRELAGSARIAVPDCYCALLDPQGSCILLLEDLAPARPGDQLVGMVLSDALCATREAARLHAAFWERGSDPAFAWLDSGPKAQPFYGPDIFRQTWPAFRERYADRLETSHLEVGDALFEGYDSYSRPRPGVRCVTHNDFRPDNFLMHDGKLTVVDWQSVALGTGAVDIAYLIGGSFAADARHEAEPRLIEAYLDELKANGVAGYDRSDFENEYRHFTFAGINVAVGAAMLVERTERGDRMFLTMLDRHVSHVRDQHALALLSE